MNPAGRVRPPRVRLLSECHEEVLMLDEPHVIERSAQPYVGIRSEVTMQTLGPKLVPLHPKVFAWLGERHTSPTGPPFWKYNVIDMERRLEVEVGLPIDAEMD